MRKCKVLPFVIIFFLVGASSASGCLCAGTRSVEEELREASAIFSGKFVAAEYRKGIVNEFRRLEEEIFGKKVNYETLVLKFQVERWWKGKPVGEVILVTNQTRDPDGTEHILGCEYPFKVGERYLVYAYGSENELGTSTCSRTRKLNKAKEDLKVLGKGKEPESGS